MRLLFWLLLAGCSSTGNSTPRGLADAAPPSCPGDLSLHADCPASYLPATDGPERLCRYDYDVHFDVGTAQGYVAVLSTHSDSWTGCYYDPNSGALVGVLLSALNYCAGITPEIDAVETLHRLTCPRPDAAAP
jgi:hypothetical protein